MKRGLVIRKRIVYKQVKIGLLVLLLLVFLVWGILYTLEIMNFFAGKVVL
jgi:hypothetical protein